MRGYLSDEMGSECVDQQAQRFRFTGAALGEYGVDGLNPAGSSLQRPEVNHAVSFGYDSVKWPRHDGFIEPVK